MKKTYLLSVLFFCCFSMACGIFSMQAQTHYGIEIGGLYNDMMTANIETKSGFSYRAGAFIHYPVFGYDEWGAGIYYVKKDVKLSDFMPQYADYIRKIDYSMNLVEIVPIALRFNRLFQKSPKIKFVPVLSLYAAYGFSGSGTLTGADANNSLFTKRIDNLFKDNQFVENNATYNFKGFKSFDVGGKIGLDCIYKQFIFRFNWTGGVIDISSYDKRLKNDSFDISLCYLFK